MIPIRQILREIKLAFGTDDIRMPTSANDFPSRMIQEDPDPEPSAAISRAGEDTITSSPLLDSGQSTDYVARDATHADGLLSQILLQSPSHPAGDPPAYPYRTILSRIKEESRQSSTTAIANTSITALGSTAADDINEAPVLQDIAPRHYSSKASVPKSQNESEWNTMRYMILPTRDKRNLRMPPPYTEYNDVTGPRGELFSDLRRNRRVAKRGGWRRLRLIIALVAVVLAGLVVGLVVGLTHSNAARGLPTSSKVGIGIGAGVGGGAMLILIWLLLSYWQR